MRIVIADDDRAARLILSRTLERWKFEVAAVSDGESAWTLIREQRPSVLIVDWLMPELDGASLCRRIREDPAHAHMYILLLSARDDQRDVVSGLDAGADDYLIKPFDPDELQARVNVGVRILALQERLAGEVAELQTALSRVRTLHGLLPICCYCKRIRSDTDYWEQIESYIAQHSDARFSHGICPGCMNRALRESDATLLPQALEVAR